MKCFRCKKEIEKEDNYFEINEYNNKKIVKIDYVHKICWNLFLKQVSDTTEAMGIVRGLKGYFQEKGILKPDEVIIQ